MAFYECIEKKHKNKSFYLYTYADKYKYLWRDLCTCSICTESVYADCHGGSRALRLSISCKSSVVKGDCALNTIECEMQSNDPVFKCTVLVCVSTWSFGLSSVYIG